MKNSSVFFTFVFFAIVVGGGVAAGFLFLGKKDKGKKGDGKDDTEKDGTKEGEEEEEEEEEEEDPPVDSDTCEPACDSGLFCTENNECVECTQSHPCSQSGSTPYCSAQGTCEECTKYAHCDGICGENYVCESCSDGDCKNGDKCLDGVCVECVDYDDCDGFCGTDNTCEKCSGSGDCEGEDKCFNGKCVGCLKYSDCDGYCDKNNVCQSCSKDTQCEGGDKCSSGFCVSDQREHGESCEVNGQCKGYCAGGTCKACSKGGHCDADNLCDGGNCVPRGSQGTPIKDWIIWGLVGFGVLAVLIVILVMRSAYRKNFTEPRRKRKAIEAEVDEDSTGPLVEAVHQNPDNELVGLLSEPTNFYKRHFLAKGNKHWTVKSDKDVGEKLGGNIRKFLRGKIGYHKAVDNMRKRFRQLSDKEQDEIEAQTRATKIQVKRKLGINARDGHEGRDDMDKINGFMKVFFPNHWTLWKHEFKENFKHADALAADEADEGEGLPVRSARFSEQG